MLSRISQEMRARGFAHVFVSASDATVRYQDVDFGNGAPGREAVELFLSGLKRLVLVQIEPRIDANGNWSIATDMLVVAFGPFNPAKATAFPLLEATSIDTETQVAFEELLDEYTISATRYMEPKQVLFH